MNIKKLTQYSIYSLSILVIGCLNLAAQAAVVPDSLDGLPIEISGDLTVIYLDDLENHRSEKRFLLKDKHSDRRFELKFEGEAPANLHSGSKIKVHGKQKDEEIYLAADGDSIETVVAAAEVVSGEQKTLVMVANFQDKNVSCPIQDIEQQMFAGPAGQSIDDLYQEMSLGATWLTGNVTGSYTISGTSTGACEWNNWVAEVEAAALADGVNLNAYNRKVFVLPKNSNCGFSGLGSVGGNPSTAIIMACDNADTYAHELGHNLGMNHASSEDQEYGDGSDFMGMGGMGLRHINAPHYEQMGWKTPTQVQTITESGFYDIASLELSEEQAIAPQALKIVKPDTNEHYYLSYRSPIGFDGNLLAGWYNKTSVHRYKGDGGKTYWLDVLADGQSYVDSVNGITFTQISHTSEYITVEVQIDNIVPPQPDCMLSAPLVSLSPSNQSANAGANLNYTFSVTNMDNSTCANSAFTLNNSIPAGWTGSFSTTSLNLAPGQTGSANLSITSIGSATANTYNITAQVSDSGEAVHSASVNATYTVLQSCITDVPGLTLSPSSQSGDAGTTLGYTVSLVNNDSAACSASTFDMSTATLPSGWDGSLSSTTMSPSPGETASATLLVSSTETSAAGTYSIQIKVLDNSESLHSKTATVTYQVNSTTPTVDSEAPTVPAELAASANFKQVSLTWLSSTDNVAVLGYRVFRDGIKIADTVDTSYVDAEGVDGVTYSYSVSAYDAMGNASLKSNSLMTGKTIKGKGGDSTGGGTKGKGNKK